MRQAGHIGGKLPAKTGDAKLPLRWAHQYLAAPLPGPQYPIDVTEGIADWGMLGNDVWGDCAQAAEFHQEMTTAAAAGTPYPRPGFTVAVNRAKKFWHTTTPPGPGTTLADYYHWLYKRGQIIAFAPVDPKNVIAKDALMQAGFGLQVGVTLTRHAETEFNHSETWGEGAVTPTPALGHAIVRVRATGTRPSDESTYVTWGAEQPATRQWDGVCVEQEWLIVTSEEKLALFTPALLADIENLHGTS